MNMQDSRIISDIKSLSESDSDYWAFRKRSKRDYCHGLMTYPAMMVPEMQGELIDILLRHNPQMEKIYDPFVGSGTVMGESMLRGLEFIGTDINPLAILCCESKADLFDESILNDALSSIKRKIFSNEYNFELVKFERVEKWFEPESLRALSRIRAAIRQEPLVWCRRFFWVALSDIVRKYSNTRLSTYKLHIKSNVEDNKEDDIYSSFITKCSRNILLKSKHWSELSSKSLLLNKHTKKMNSLRVEDVRQLDSTFKVDLVVSSPPYGDNSTTVTYGQYSFLPLQFIDLNDINSKFDRGLVRNQSSIDTASLGGCLNNWNEQMVALDGKSEALNRSVRSLVDLSRGGERRLISFAYDLYTSLKNISGVLKANGFLMFTLGNRNINKLEIPLHFIVKEFLEFLGMREVLLFERSIPNKRMPGSMSNEYILIMRKE